MKRLMIAIIATILLMLSFCCVTETAEETFDISVFIGYEVNVSDTSIVLDTIPYPNSIVKLKIDSDYWLEYNGSEYLWKASGENGRASFHLDYTATKKFDNEKYFVFHLDTLIDSGYVAPGEMDYVEMIYPFMP